MPRRITTICPEGWYYLFVLLFIIGGAVLREVNLLVVLAGMMIGPVLFNWRIAKLMLRDIDFERKLPARTFAGAPLSVAISAYNHRRRLASWGLVLDDTLRLEDAPGARTDCGFAASCRMFRPDRRRLPSTARCSRDEADIGLVRCASRHDSRWA